MIKKTIITMMFALVTIAGLAQTKTATVTGYSPALKDGTVAVCYYYCPIKLQPNVESIKIGVQT